MSVLKLEMSENWPRKNPKMTMRMRSLVNLASILLWGYDTQAMKSSDCWMDTRQRWEWYSGRLHYSIKKCFNLAHSDPLDLWRGFYFRKSRYCRWHFQADLHEPRVGQLNSSDQLIRKFLFPAGLSILYPPPSPSPNELSVGKRGWMKLSKSIELSKFIHFSRILRVSRSQIHFGFLILSVFFPPWSL